MPFLHEIRHISPQNQNPNPTPNTPNPNIKLINAFYTWTS